MGMGKLKFIMSVLKVAFLPCGLNDETIYYSLNYLINIKDENVSFLQCKHFSLLTGFHHIFVT